MQQYLWDGQAVSEDQLLAEAESRNISLAELIDANPKLEVKPFSAQYVSGRTYSG